jgi:SAM-dependent methyltransferase
VASERAYEGSELELFEGAVNWKAYWAAKLAPFVTGRVLEVGAGRGANLAAFGAVAGRQWTLLEPDPALCDAIRHKIDSALLPAGTTVACGMLRDLPPRADFTSILYIDVLEHIEDDRAEMAAAAERLAPGGHLVVLCPAHQAVFSPFDSAIGHFRRYDRRGLLTLTPPSLVPVTTFYLDSLGLALSAVNRYVARQSAPTPATVRFWDSAVVPLSRIFDPLSGYRLGRSVIAVWTKKGAASA